MTVVPPLPGAAVVRRIACVMLNGVGDLLCVTPTFAAFKQRYPEASLTVVMRREGRALVEGNPHVSEIIFFEGSSVARFARTVRALRQRRFDLWVELHVPTFNTVRSNHRDYFRNGLLMACVGATYRLAYGVSFLRPLLTHRVAKPAFDELRSVNIVDITLALAAPTPGLTFRKHMPVSDADRRWAAAALPASQAPRVALFFGSRQAADVWPEASAVEFIERLTNTYPQMELVLIGGPFETDFARRISAQLRGRTTLRVYDFVAQASLTQTAALLERCAVFVSTDSGPMHIADALGIPLVALFSSKNYLPVWRPMDPRAIVINHPVDCGPCLQATCPIDNRCMTLITANEVLRAVAALLPRPTTTL